MLGRAGPWERRELTACLPGVCLCPPRVIHGTLCLQLPLDARILKHSSDTKYSSRQPKQKQHTSYHLETQPVFFLSQAEACPHFNAFTAFIKRSENSVYLIYN